MVRTFYKVKLMHALKLEFLGFDDASKAERFISVLSACISL
jgi:hypothetical protein